MAPAVLYTFDVSACQVQDLIPSPQKSPNTDQLSKKQIPKLCFKNGLQLSPIPECMKLTSLGNQLLAKYILFLKLRETKSLFGRINDRVSRFTQYSSLYEITNIIPR